MSLTYCIVHKKAMIKRAEAMRDLYNETGNRVREDHWEAKVIKLIEQLIDLEMLFEGRGG